MTANNLFNKNLGRECEFRLFFFYGLQKKKEEWGQECCASFPSLDFSDKDFDYLWARASNRTFLLPPFFSFFVCFFCIGLCDAPTTTLRGLVVLRSRVIVSPFPFLAEINRQLEVNGGHHSVFGSYFAFALCSLLFSRLHHESTIHPCSVSAAEATR